MSPLSWLLAQSSNPAILPYPKSVDFGKGIFIISEKTVICYDNAMRFIDDAEVFNEYLLAGQGFSLPVINGSRQQSNSIIIKQLEDISAPSDAYKLLITKDSIVIEGKEAGVFYAFQTLRQLFPAKISDKIEVPCLKIYDYPLYAWRGMHLDVSRHFFSPEEVKKYIDHIAFYKMNTFHWHLTDDQGWRIEIEKYPKLTSVGAWRNGTLIGHYTDQPHKFDTIRYGGFYTKEQIRDIIRYAERRHINIVPEIELPGHSMAAIAAYPQFACNKGSYEVAKLWGVFEDVYCTKDETLDFLKDVLSEVIELFPSKYIHIGGDECPKIRWEKCPACQEIMKKQGLKDGHELQSYVIRSIEKFVNSKGRIIIGWDEILEGGLAPNAVVMSWRGTEGGIASAKQQHYVIMCPGSHCYFDHYQDNPANEPLAIGGNTTIEKVYSFNPMPAALNQAEQKYILGAQANVWTEYIDNFSKVEYMAIPRMIALSEVLWTENSKLNYNDFYARLKVHSALLDKMKINYRKLK